MRVRAATVDDVPAVLALEGQLFGPDAWSEGSVREELTGDGRVALVACGPDLVGYVVTAAAGDVVDLHRIAVHPSHRRRGLARELLSAAAGRALPGRMLLEVGVGNQAALAFYASEGFVEIDRRRGYYRDGSDAVVMQRPHRP
jgi:[ribosomal protein S18]-alanine N-acetyltransferase